VTVLNRRALKACDAELMMVRISDAGFRGDDHPSLCNMIHASLRTSILNGSLLPGQVLRQEELAAQFRTSRVPLREALQLLQAEGLVILRPRRGYAVHALSGEGLLELLRLRILVEGYGGYMGTLHRTQKDVSLAAALMLDMEKMAGRLSRETQRARWWTLNRQFHRAIFSCGRDTQISQIYDNITGKIDPYLMHAGSMSEHTEEALDDHRRIFAAFSKGDADECALLSRAHCESLAKYFADGLLEEGQVAGAPEPAIGDLGPALGKAALGGAARRSTARPKPARASLARA
jgi:DNA-binding GntR family transcriptional regulator